jgi:hypothetical protein
MDKNIGERADNAYIYLLNASYAQVPYLDVFGIKVCIFFFSCRVVATVRILYSQVRKNISILNFEFF